MASELIKSHPNTLSLVSGMTDLDPLKPLQTRIYLDSVYVAGISHLEDPGIVLNLKENEQLVLIREDNPFDELAVMILNVQGQKLGYIPRRKNPIFARLLDAGKELNASVERCEKFNGSPTLKCGIYLVDF